VQTNLATGLQPLAIIGEIGAGGPHQHRVSTERTDRVRHISRDAAPMHHKVVDEEAQRHLLQVFGEQLLGEPARETHQMIGRNGTGHRNRHELTSASPRRFARPRGPYLPVASLAPDQ
jgi:hypothetical protein